jgi:hypothetical protein
MSLFTVYSFIQLTPDDKARFERIAKASEKTADVLDQILTKLNSDGITPEQAAAVTADLKAHDDPAAASLAAAGGPDRTVQAP